MDKDNTRKYSKIAYLSSVLMIIGIHLPLYIQNNGSDVVEIFRTNNEGIMLLISAMLVIIQKKTERNKYMFISFAFDIGVVVYFILLMTKDKEFGYIGAGFICIAIAIFILFISLFARRAELKEYTHEFSTMRVVKTEEYEYTDKIKMSDIGWIIAVIIFSIIFVFIKLNMDKRNSFASSEKILTNNVSASEEKNKSSTKCDFENEIFCVSVIDGYLTNENGEEVVFIEVSLKNKTKEKVIFNEMFEIFVSQDEKNLQRCTKVESEIFDDNSILTQISLFETSKVYVPFILKDGQKSLSVTLKTIDLTGEGSNIVIDNKKVKINDLYYVDTLDEIITIAEKKIKAEDKAANKNDDNESVSIENLEPEVSSHTPTSTPQASIEPTAEEISEATDSPSVEPTQKQEEDKKNIVSGTVKFVKPEQWGEDEKIYIDFYENESDVMEKSRIASSGYEEGVYTFMLSDIDMSGDVYITFSNEDEELYPDNNKKLTLVMGKKYEAD